MTPGGQRQCDGSGCEYLLRPGDKASSRPTASRLAITANLITATLGCGILSLPWATAGASLLPSMVLTILVLALNAGTNMILVLAADKHQVYDLGGLMGKLSGYWGFVVRTLCDATIWLSVFLCLVGYLIVVADSLEALLPTLPRASAVAVGATVALPLSLMDQRRLAFSSVLSIAGNIYIFVLLLASLGDGDWRTAGGSDDHRCLLGLGKGTVTLVSALMQAAVVQMCVLPMYEQLDRRSPERFAACLTASFGFVSMLFVAFSCAGYLIFGPSVASNILLNLPGGWQGDVARLVMAAAVMGVYPLLITSIIAPLQHHEEAALPPELALSTAMSARRRWPCPWARPSRLATVLVVLGSALAALKTKDLGEVNVLSGAVQVAAMVAIAPGLTGLFLLGWVSVFWRAAMALLIACGLSASVLGLTFTDNYVGQLQERCLWALMPE